MTKTYCDCCGKEIDFDYTRCKAYYDISTTWHEPHQTTDLGNGMMGCTLLNYIHPGDVKVTLCEKCGSKITKFIKNKIEELKNKEYRAFDELPVIERTVVGKFEPTKIVSDKGCLFKNPNVKLDFCECCKLNGNDDFCEDCIISVDDAGNYQYVPTKWVYR